jgi:hypothetical protein
MYISFTNTIIKNIKDSILHNKITQQIFSYNCTIEHGGILVFHQNETGFSLSVETEKTEGVLRLKSFTLNYIKQLKSLSSALYDAAIIEITLETLAILFEYACQQNIVEIFFMLSHEEAQHLTSFEGLLDSCASQITRVGKKTVFSLFIFLDPQKLLLEKIELVRSQIKFELWKAQRFDHYLKAYLQNQQKGNRLPSCHLTVQPVPLTNENVLAFPIKEFISKSRSDR